ncbi:MAG: ABC transporter ATP-binding protein [Bacteroidales bacterium]|nr:ABC transporter ATP-binding protein [Bacteroidales bacterium]
MKNINFNVRRGDFYAIMGPNGCGKTTLLRCMAGLLTPDSGSVSVNGNPVGLISPRRLAQQMAYVQQQLAPDFDFTAEEVVLMARTPYQRPLQSDSPDDHAIVQQSMLLTSTWHLRGQRLSQMSGGERQRVLIARALAQQTPVLLLDEPLSNLDIAHQFAILELLRRLNQQESKTILLVIHHIELAYEYCPSLLLLHDGAVAFSGPMSQGLSPESVCRVFGVDADIYNNHIVLSSRS